MGCNSSRRSAKVEHLQEQNTLSDGNVRTQAKNTELTQHDARRFLEHELEIDSKDTTFTTTHSSDTFVTGDSKNLAKLTRTACAVAVHVDPLTVIPRDVTLPPRDSSMGGWTERVGTEVSSKSSDSEESQSRGPMSLLFQRLREQEQEQPANSKHTRSAPKLLCAITDTPQATSTSTLMSSSTASLTASATSISKSTSKSGLGTCTDEHGSGPQG